MAVVMVPSEAVATLQTNSIGQRYFALTSVDVEGAAAPDVPPERRLYTVKKFCCCGITLATGVYVIAMLEVLGSLMSIVSSCVMFYMKSKEKKIDHAIMHQEEDVAPENPNDGSSSMDNGPPPLTNEEKVERTNMIIDAAFYMAPFVLVIAIIGLYFSCLGLKAARGDAHAARRYAVWKRFLVIWGFITVLFSFGNMSSLMSFFLSCYFFVVVRSHAIECTRLELEEAAAQNPAV